jgi:uncharacterized RDD family membrane protein YckC
MSAPDQGSWNDKLTIETPEQTSLDYPLSGVGSRCLALLLDTLVQIGAILLLLAVLYYLLAWKMGSGGIWIQAFIYFAFFALIWGYYGIFESIWNGQTPGKRWVRLRVIQESGKPLQVWQALARNLLRLVDQLPGFYAVGLVSVLLSKQNRRLGDFVAGTVVVHERPLVKIELGWTGAAATAASSTPLGTGRLGMEEVRLIETFLERRSSLTDNVRVRMANQIAARITLRLGIDMDARRNAGLMYDETFLEAVARERLGIRNR